MNARHSDSVTMNRDAVDLNETRRRQMVFVGAVGMLIVLVGSVTFVTWQSYQEWGALPSWTGDGPILYGGLAAGFLIVALFVVWSWLRVRSLSRN